MLTVGDLLNYSYSVDGVRLVTDLNDFLLCYLRLVAVLWFNFAFPPFFSYSRLSALDLVLCKMNIALFHKGWTHQ